jgi:hypothetical protein
MNVEAATTEPYKSIENRPRKAFRDNDTDASIATVTNHALAARL